MGVFDPISTPDFSLNETATMMYMLLAGLVVPNDPAGLPVRYSTDEAAQRILRLLRGQIPGATFTLSGTTAASGMQGAGSYARYDFPNVTGSAQNATYTNNTGQPQLVFLNDNLGGISQANVYLKGDTTVLAVPAVAGEQRTLFNGDALNMTYTGRPSLIVRYW